MDQKCKNDKDYNKDLDENLTWLTQKPEDPKVTKGTLLSPTHSKCD